MFASLILSASVVLLSDYFLPDEFVAYVFFPGFLLTAPFFPTEIHGGRTLWLAMTLASIALYAVGIYAGLRFLSHHRWLQ